MKKYQFLVKFRFVNFPFISPIHIRSDCEQYLHDRYNFKALTNYATHFIINVRHFNQIK